MTQKTLHVLLLLSYGQLNDLYSYRSRLDHKEKLSWKDFNVLCVIYLDKISHG